MKINRLVSFICLCVVPSLQLCAQTSSSDPNGLTKRYESLVCAIVLIQTERGTGTGFFINSQGDIVTAAHVVSSKTFKNNMGQVDFDINVDQHVSITPHGEAASLMAADNMDETKWESSTDLAFIHSKLTPPCFLPLGDAASVKTGNHLLSIGFPGIDNGNPILYEGFLSGRFKHPPIAMATVNGQGIVPQYEVLKVQMPITPGASGSPIIDDSGHAVGVISESPIIWTQDLENITKVAGTGSGITMSGFDAVKILGQLAVVVREFESPGSAYAVPISGLLPTRGAVPTVSKHVH